MVFFLLVAAGSASCEKGKYWIYFTQKSDNGSLALYRHVENRLSEHARERRAKVCRGPFLIDHTDLPVPQHHLSSLKQLNIQPVVISKWLNAVSAFLSPEQVPEIEKCPFVSRVVKVQRFASVPFEYEYVPTSSQLKKHIFDYGASYEQYNLNSIPAVHDLGYFGQGVRIALFDTGFRLTHAALQHIKVIAAYDFINHDPVVDNESGQDEGSQNFHGTAILSIIGGYLPGQLVGPAFKAEYLLAKTEDIRSETIVEEDNWVAAAEWADSLGADIISTSLGYTDWYTYDDMDGDTAPITIAADLAVKKGILVVVSAGNEGDKLWHYVSAPADGDSVLSVGAIRSTGTIADFSSRGPTSDGRLKPEVVAMGIGVLSVTNQSDELVRISGTSAACPIIAGVAAMLLSASPALSPMQVREAIIKTADRSMNPDNTYGYGVASALQALGYWEVPRSLPESSGGISAFPNPFSWSRHMISRILIDSSVSQSLNMEIYNVLGQKILTVQDGIQLAGGQRCFIWDGRDQSGTRVPVGAYYCRIDLNSFSKTVAITVNH